MSMIVNAISAVNWEPKKIFNIPLINRKSLPFFFFFSFFLGPNPQHMEVPRLAV